MATEPDDYESEQPADEKRDAWYQPETQWRPAVAASAEIAVETRTAAWSSPERIGPYTGDLTMSSSQTLSASLDLSEMQWLWAGHDGSVTPIRSGGSGLLQGAASDDYDIPYVSVTGDPPGDGTQYTFSGSMTELETPITIISGKKYAAIDSDATVECSGPTVPESPHTEQFIEIKTMDMVLELYDGDGEDATLLWSGTICKVGDYGWYPDPGTGIVKGYPTGQPSEAEASGLATHAVLRVSGDGCQIIDVEDPQLTTLFASATPHLISWPVKDDFTGLYKVELLDSEDAVLATITLGDMVVGGPNIIWSPALNLVASPGSGVAEKARITWSGESDTDYDVAWYLSGVIVKGLS